MPAKSEAQRRYLNAAKGHGWVKAHGYGNAGGLPARARKSAHKGKRKRSK